MNSHPARERNLGNNNHATRRNGVIPNSADGAMAEFDGVNFSKYIAIRRKPRRMFLMSLSSLALAGMPASNPARALYSPREVESILGISHASLYRLIGAGRLDARKFGSATRITWESIERFITELPKVGLPSTSADAA